MRRFFPTCGPRRRCGSPSRRARRGSIVRTEHFQFSAALMSWGCRHWKVDQDAGESMKQEGKRFLRRFQNLRAAMSPRGCLVQFGTLCRENQPVRAGGGKLVQELTPTLGGIKEDFFWQDPCGGCEVMGYSQTSYQLHLFFIIRNTNFIATSLFRLAKRGFSRF